MVAASELSINTNASATAMANSIFGNGVTVVSASYTGDALSSATYTGGDATSPGVVPGDEGVILSTGHAEDFTNTTGESNQSANTSTNSSGVGNNQFTQAAGAGTADAAYMDVDFIPTGSVMTMQFVFASEEYPEYAVSQYQDFFGVWVNGSQVDINVGDGDVDPGNMNSGANENLFIDNTTDAYNTEMDGFTVALTLTMNVTPNAVNSIRIGIADVLDSTFDVLANDTNTTPNTAMTITHLNGQPVSAGSTVTLNTGQSVTLNANGTLTLTGDGDEEDWNFSYTVDNGTDDDVGIVNVSWIPCFVAGTMILTPEGEKRVESLAPGDMVITKDDGPQPLRWIGKRLVKAEGDYAPIHIRAGTFGDHRDVLVSPLHRVLIRDSLAELLFGETEVLVAARDLVNDSTVRVQNGGDVVYVHFLFDKHQVVLSDGLETESFLPGPQVTDSLEAEIVDEICAIFPELDPMTGEGYSPAARRTLKKYEAQVLMRLSQEAA